MPPSTSSASEDEQYKEIGDLEAGAPEPRVQAAVMPDGSLVMLSPENPYRDAIQESEPQLDSQEASEAAIQATIALLRPALRLERMARLVCAPIPTPVTPPARLTRRSLPVRPSPPLLHLERTRSAHFPPSH